MGRARRLGPFNRRTIGKIETVLEVWDARWRPLEPKFKPNFLVDFR
jgi:hypothetical protein